jgi:hypothetical protein
MHEKDDDEYPPLPDKEQIEKNKKRDEEKRKEKIAANKKKAEADKEIAKLAADNDTLSNKK